LSGWEERITTASRPDVRLEHELRYRAAAGIVAASDVWCDLGCGAGVAAAGAIESFSGRAVLVDRDEDAVREAAKRVRAGETTEVVADISDTDGLRSVKDAVLPAGAGAITCFEVIQHLDRFAPVVELIVELVEEHAFTAVLSVPNDAFVSVDNPYHDTIWGESAVRELRSLLQRDHVVAAQVPMTGSWISRGPDRLTLSADLSADRVPTHFIVAFGPRAEDLDTPARVGAADLDEQRHWERQREADLEYYRSLAEQRSP
jgi:SAM-dependent methyltransferase